VPGRAQRLTRSGSPPGGLDLETVLESTTDAVFVLDRDWRFTYLNRQARTLIAGGRELAGEPISELFPESVGGAFWQAYRTAMAGEAATAEAFYAPLGTWFEVRAYPLEGAIAVFFRDVGEKKRHEEERDRLLAELRYEHTLLEGVLKQLPVGILVAEAPSGRILLHNDAARALLQDALPTGEGLPGLARLGALHPDGRPYAAEDYALARALTKGEEIEREPVLYRHPDGGTTHLTVSAGPVRDAAGAIVAAVVAFDDVTELHQTIERHRLALAAAEMGDWRWDAATDLMNFSERAREIFGFAPGETVTRRRLRGFCHQGDLAKAEATIERAAAERSRYRAEYRYTRPSDGVERWLVTMGHATSRPDGALAGITGVVLDTTERKQAEELQHLLVRELHHRVKNTLATVQAIVGATARSAPSADAFTEAFTGRILSLAKTHDLLTAGDRQTTSLRGLLESELHAYDDPGRRRVELEGPPVELSSEEAVPLGMAVHELTTNAAKYGALSRPEGRLAVRWDLAPAAEGATSGLVLHLSWRERGGPPASAPEKLGFGARLLNRVLTAQLSAELDVRFEAEGLELHLRAPLRGRPGLEPKPG
jgi:PAS domain S-box-containing protein